MYQFSEAMGSMVSKSKKTYRWRGLGLGLVGGWLPAWGINYYTEWGVWGFAFIWVLCLPLGYWSGKLVKKN